MLNSIELPIKPFRACEQAEVNGEFVIYLSKITW